MSACKGMNCGCTDGVGHSVECRAEHAAALAGGWFMKTDVTPEEYASYVHGARMRGLKPYTFREYQALASGTTTRAHGGSEC